MVFHFIVLDLPLYNQDLEGEVPKSVVQFKAEIAAADALLFVTPEHNRSIPALLKNAIDWGARPYGQNAWSGRPAAITGASPGAIGAALAQMHLRQVLGILGVLVMGGEAYISFKPGLVDANGTISDENTRTRSCKLSSNRSRRSWPNCSSLERRPPRSATGKITAPKNSL